MKRPFNHPQALQNEEFCSRAFFASDATRSRSTFENHFCRELKILVRSASLSRSASTHFLTLFFASLYGFPISVSPLLPLYATCLVFTIPVTVSHIHS